jgi:processive 1,2-diacylglycerol beta-glucosyltransferase
VPSGVRLRIVRTRGPNWPLTRERTGRDAIGRTGCQDRIPIPGQEVRNSDFLLEEGAAVRCNYPTTVGYKIDQLLARPDRLTRMAACARQIGRAQAGPMITSAILADDSPPLWISHAAQKSVLDSSEQGIAAANLYAGRRVRTLIDAPTGLSAGVITTAQLDALLPITAGSASSGTTTFRFQRTRLQHSDAAPSRG